MISSHLNRIMRKPSYWGKDQIRHKLSCTTTEDGNRLEISNIEDRGICYPCIEKLRSYYLRGSLCDILQFITAVKMFIFR